MTKSISNAEIKALAEKAVNLISADKDKEVVDTLRPLLDTKCPFLKLDLLGKETGGAGSSQPQKFFRSFDEIIDYNAMGGFVVVGQALICFLPDNFEKVMEKSRKYIIKGDVWYACDIIGERCLGQALIDYFDETLPWIAKFLKDENRWVKRSAGVAIHFFSKRVLDEQEKTRKLLKLIEPYMEEKQVDVIKGIGWGLKTIGRHHPDILVEFLYKQIKLKKNISGLMMKKALTYIDEDKKLKIENITRTGIRAYQSKAILNTHKHCDGGWFWDKYSAFPYIGCEWGCEYCYLRDGKYNPHKSSLDPKVLNFADPFSQYIKVKKNAPELLRKALENMPRDLIYLDNYQPVDFRHQYTRKMLKVCLDLSFPVFINEKSRMLLRDLDVLKKINKKTYLNVGWSIITTCDDKTRKIFEPNAPPVSARFNAMKKLAENKILTGTVFMPILPFIYGDEKNIEEVIKKTKECGGRYVLDGGLTLHGYSKTHFYKVLEKYDPDLSAKYNRIYGNPELLADHTAQVHEKVLEYCQKYKLTPHIPRPVNFYPKKLQVNKKTAEKFYLKAREMQMSGKGGHREWAYRKAAWALDDLEESIEKIYRDKGISGVMEIKGIGKSLANKIENFLIKNEKEGHLHP